MHKNIFVFVLPLLVFSAGATGVARPAFAAEANTWRFDFGGTPVAEGYVGVDHALAYTAERGYGWTAAPEYTRDRGVPGDLRRDMMFSRTPATLRVDVPPGVYQITLLAGDQAYGDHVTHVTIPGLADEPIVLDPKRVQFVTATLAGRVDDGKLEFRFDSPSNNWVINALTIVPAEAPAPLATTREFYRGTPEERDTWVDISKWDDPTAPLVATFRQNVADDPAFEPTGLTRKDYLTLAAGVVDFFKQQQDERGAIIDPYRKEEFQYSTPCFALTAAALVKYAGREDLLEPAARAMDWACETLNKKKAATGHEDFFPPQLAHALVLLKPLVPAERAARWEHWLGSYDPFVTYAVPPGGGNWGGGENWNVIAASGEGLLHQLGLRPSIDFVELSFAAQGYRFSSPWGLYTESPMCYDIFPRMYVADLLSTGFQCRGSDRLAEVNRRGMLTSLFMQSPTGELPTGGRSAQHVWNEAEQCVSFEIAAAQYAAAGDAVLAGAFKRAAHLSARAMRPWVRPSGEFWVLKNHNDPAVRHGYEWYTSHSQYNLLAAAMLAMAYDHAATTESVAEHATPADVGGYVIRLDSPFNKVIANAAGMYVEIDYSADLHYNPTGLLRVHRTGCDPQIGPSDGLVEKPSYAVPEGPGTTAAVGVAWQTSAGDWQRLAQTGLHDKEPAGPAAPLRVAVDVIEQTPAKVAFRLTYDGNFDGPERVIETYVLTPTAVELKTELPGYGGPTQMVWPVLANDGAHELAIDVNGARVVVASPRGSETFTPVGSATITLPETRYACRNGWARLGVAEFPAGVAPTLRITPTSDGKPYADPQNGRAE